MSDPTETAAETAREAAREAFFAKISDPPDNVSVVVERAEKAAEAAAQAPKARTAAADATAAAAPPKAGAGGAPPQAPTPDAVLDALRAGDLDRVAELTGADPADFDEKSTKWAARNRREFALKRELDRVSADTRAVVEHYEPLEQQREAYEASGGRDLGPVRAIVEHVTGRPWAELAPQLGLAAPGTAPPSPAADRVLIESLRDDVPDDHEARRVPDWEVKAVALLRESVDPLTGDPSISFRQAAARVLRHAREDYRKLSAVFGAAEPAPRPAQPTTPQRAETAAPGRQRKMTRDEFLARFSGPGKD